MKPQTKKTIIIVMAIAIVATIIYFAFFAKAKAGTPEGYIDRLNVDRATKKAIKSYLAEARTEDLAANMAANPGLNAEQVLALTAAYHLVPGTVSDATWQDWKAQIAAM